MNKLLLLFAVAFIFSCKTPAVITKTTPAILPETKTNVESNSIIDSVQAHAFHFKYFSARAKVVVNDSGDLTEFTANIRVRNDSAIWVSISPALGIEVARVLMTTDSVRVIDRIHNERMSAGYNFFSKFTSLPITLETVQDLIEGNPLFISTKKGYQILKNDSLIVLTSVDSLTIDSLIFSRGYLPWQQNISDRKAGSLSTQNDQYDIQYTTPFSLWRKIILHHPDEVTIEITFSKIKIDEPLQFPFKSE